MFESVFYNLTSRYRTDMEWGYKFTDHPSAVAECLRNWKSTLALDHDQKYIVVFDITNTSRFSIKTLLQLSGFIALNKKRIKAQTKKVKIVLKSAEQEKILKSGLRMTPFLVDFEIVRQDSNVSYAHDAAAS